MSVNTTTIPTNRRWIGRVGVIAAPAGLAFTLAIVRTGQIPLWRDEYATAMFASLSPAELFAATSHVDAVLAPYYLLIHALSPALGWGLGMRVVSIVAFVGTAAAVAAIGWRWWGPVGGVAAGVAIALNGDALAAAVNARPYALSLFFLSLSVLLADRAIRSGRAAAWVAYAAAGAAAVALQLFAVLAVGAIGVLVIDRRRSTARSWLIASAPAAATAAGLLLVGVGHRGQLVWLGRPDAREAVSSIARSSGLSADRAVALDALALALLVIAGALSIVAARSLASGRFRDEVRTRIFASTLMLVPPILLFALSWMITPVFMGKYFIWSSLGAALLIGGAVALLLPPWKATGLVAGVIAIALIVLAAAITGLRLMDPPPRGDDFPATVRALEDSAAVGDTLVVAQPYAFGGVAYGMAVAAGDDANAAEIRKRAVTGSQPVLDTRRITALNPLRTTAEYDSPPSETTWVVTIFPLTDAQLDTVDDRVAACVRAMDFGSPTERYGAVRLFRLDCD